MSYTIVMKRAMNPFNILRQMFTQAVIRLRQLPERTVVEPLVSYFRLERAFLCVQCEHVTNTAMSCPCCTSTGLIPLATVLNRGK